MTDEEFTPDQHQLLDTLKKLMFARNTYERLRSRPDADPVAVQRAADELTYFNLEWERVFTAMAAELKAEPRAKAPGKAEE